MVYPFLSYPDGTEISHSEMLPNGTCHVYVEKRDEDGSCHRGRCTIPGYRWDDVEYLTLPEFERYDEIIHSTAHLIMEFSQEGGFAGASTI